MVDIIKGDLEFILRQIKISEANAAGTPLDQIYVDRNGNVVAAGTAGALLAISDPLAPYGLRTVDGGFNNLVEGREQWGAADGSFPRLTDPFWRNENDDSITFGAGSPGQVAFTDGNYGEHGAPPPASQGLGGGTVVDADPRLISNLIVDQTLGNPAVIYAALVHAGAAPAAILPAIAQIQVAYEQAMADYRTANPGATALQSMAFASGAPTVEALLTTHGIEMDGTSVMLPNVAPDEGLSASFNSWFTLFGQFFDHGLDLVAKEKNGTVYIPLSVDDPLYNPASPHTNFMVLTRSTTGAANLTTPWVDQNQTYSSNASKQLFMREYELDAQGRPVATGRLLSGADGGLATWADVKEQAAEKLGVLLTDADIGSVPLFVMDDYGRFVPGANGMPQLVVGLGPDGMFGGGDDVFVEGNFAAPISPSALGAVRTGHAFLDDIAHAAVPVVTGGVLQQDGDAALGYANADGSAGPLNARGTGTAYDNEMLDRHFITGDGRGNENIGLTAVHHVFHSEHNGMIDQIKQKVLASGDRDFINEWLDVPLEALPTAGATLDWNGERLFQTARFTTEMQYQHLVFEEFARKIQPDVDVFVFNPSTDINPAIFAEFAHVVYRFGHSMLTESVDRVLDDGSRADLDLFDAFLNPIEFGGQVTTSSGPITLDHDQAAGAVIRGMTSQVGNEIDEFVTDVLRNQLLGIPLDLAALNIARGREAGIPPLNLAREQFKEIANGDTQLDPYTSWMDFALNLKNPASVVNFIAAYGTHETITSASTAEAKRDAAWNLVFGHASLDETDRQNFLNARGQYAAVETTGPLAGYSLLGGLNLVDLWVGGLAEKKMAFGGMLGSTFSFVFELQMENLQNADRFYYLSRVQGLNFLNELENNSFAKMLLNNTDLGEEGYALPGDVFSVPDHVLYMDKNEQQKFGYVDPTQEDPFLQAISPMIERRDANTDGVAEYIRVNSNDHVLIQGTNGNDHIIAGGGDDSVWGRDGDDRIEAGYGVDKIHGGKGNDIITNSGTDIGEVDMLHGEEGNDVIHGGSGLALIFGNQGSDFIITGPDGKEAFGGTDNDFIIGGEGADFLLGNEGDDWIEGGGGFDTTAGDNSQLFFNSRIIGHDVMFAGSDEHDFDAESGDDIMVQGESVMRNEGMLGFDWAIHKGNTVAANDDLTKPIFTTDEQDILRDRFDAVEALSGWDRNDVLRGDDRGDAATEAGGGLAGAENTMTGHELDQAGIARIRNLSQIVTADLLEQVQYEADGSGDSKMAFVGGNVLLGGGGSDTIQGRGGDDIIDGDRWLNVRIAVKDASGAVLGSAEGMTAKVTGPNGADLFGGKPLQALMLDGTLQPGQLEIVREILKDDGVGDIDTAVYWDVRANYTISRGPDGSVIVSHTGFDPANRPAGTNFVSDGVDRLHNMERLQFADQTVTLSPPSLQLNGFDVATRSLADNFNTAAYTNNGGNTNFKTAWTETLDAGGATGGSVRVAGGVLQFSQGNVDDAAVTRHVDLSGARSATVTFSVNDANVGGLFSGDNEEIFFDFAADGVNFVTLRTFDGGNGGNITVQLPTGVPFTDNAAIRFRANNSLETGESFSIDNLAITANVFVPANPPSIDINSAYTENGAAAAVGSDPRIVEDSNGIVSASVVLTNAKAGDRLFVQGNLPNGISANVNTTVAGVITLTLSGTATPAAYEAAIQAVRFENTTNNPDTAPRTIQVAVSDGMLDSNVATATVNVTAVNDQPAVNNDTVITNVATGSFVLPEWALLRNDSDPEGAALAVTAVSAFNGLTVTRANGSLTVTDTGIAGGSFTYTATDGSGAANATDTGGVTLTRDATGTVDGTTADNILVGNDAASTFDAGTGNDIVFAGGGNDTAVWNAASVFGATISQDGRDFVDGGAGTDAFIVNGDGTAEAFVVRSRAAALADGIVIQREEAEIVITRNGAVIAELDNIEEITVNTGPGADTVTTRGNFDPTSLAFNTIHINGSSGNDTVDITALQSAHRIVLRTNGGNDTIIGTLRPQDVIELPNGQTLADYARTVNANGTTTYTKGTHSVTLQAPASEPGEGGSGGGQGAFALTARDLQGLKNLINGRNAFDGEDDTEGHAGIRDLEGTGNNTANPDYGSADQHFIRLTTARYGELNATGNNREVNPIFEGLDARAISNLLGTQEADLPKQANDANIFFMAFGQYFDHGLDFVPKNTVYGTIEIGGPGSLRAPGTDNPADLTRAEVDGLDANGIPQHVNKTSPYVDQNQAYGSNELVGQFLRESDGDGGVGMRLLAGVDDPSSPGFKLLPTLREMIQHHWEANTVFHDASLPNGAISFRDYYSNFAISETATGNLFDEATGSYDPDVLNAAVSNFMGSGFPLLLDTNPFVSLLDHYVAGDGRANENFALTAMHTVWARNHNYHVEKLVEASFDGTPEEVFQAAKMMNEAEYQRVVFDEFADALLGGMRGLGSHGHAGYNPDVDARISHEFASAVYRVGHSLIGQTMTVLDENGQPKQVALFDAFLNPSNDPSVFTGTLPPGYVPQPGYAQLGVGSILGGIATQQAEEVDFNIVDAVRNDLVRINADLFSFNVARGRDVGLGTLNQVRADLKASGSPYIREAIGFAGNMDPYASWEDFQARNGLSASVIAQMKQAYPDLVLDTPEEIADFVAANPSIALLDGTNGAKIVKGIDRVDLWVGGLAEQHINGGMVGQTFWVVLHEQFDRLQEGDRFYYTDRFDNFDFYEDFVDGQDFADIIARNTGLTNLPEDIFSADLDDDGPTGGTDDEDEDEDDGDGPPVGGDDDDDTDEDEDDEDDTPPVGGGEDDEDEDDDDDDGNGQDDDDDEVDGGEDDDTDGPGTGNGGGTGTGTTPPVVGTPAADVLAGTAVDDNLIGFGGDDVIMGHAGADAIVAGDGNDFVHGGEGRDVISAGLGDDHVFGGAGADMIHGDAGDDRLFGDAGDDLIDAGAGNDLVMGGAGNDLLVASKNDGDDTYFGDEPNGGAGVDTLDMSAVTTTAKVDLGTGLGGRGSAWSSQTGSDTLWGVENVVTGSGADDITASNAVNIMDGGAGNDVFRFLSAEAANNDTILNFQAGDVLDLTGMDANAALAGNQAFTLVAGPSFTAAAQLMVSYETRADGDYTVVQGNTGGDAAAEFKLSLKGTHELDATDFKF
jgi:Ca2+-binding RTX toxin-like protein